MIFLKYYWVCVMDTLPEEIIDLILDDELSLLMGMVSKRWYNRLPPYGVSQSLASVVGKRSYLAAYRACNGKLLLKHLQGHNIPLIDRFYKSEQTRIRLMLPDSFRPQGRRSKYTPVYFGIPQLHENSMVCNGVNGFTCSVLKECFASTFHTIDDTLVELHNTRIPVCGARHVLTNKDTYLAFMYAYGLIDLRCVLDRKVYGALDYICDSTNVQIIGDWLKDNPCAVEFVENLDLLGYLLKNGADISNSVRRRVLNKAIVYHRKDILDML